MKAHVEIEAIVNPTESVEKLEQAITSVLGDVDLRLQSRGEDAALTGRMEGIESLDHLREHLRRRRIRGAARAFLTRRAEDGVLSFGLNRQAAYVGRVSFYHKGEAPLGPIQVTIRGNVAEVIDFLCEGRG